MMNARTLVVGFAIAGLAACAAAPVKTVSWNDIASRPLPPPATRIYYGADPQEFGELRLPQGAGPFPVAMVIHGGCWLADYDYKHITHLAAALTREGIATWTVEYRRVGNPGGGWPGTFKDIAVAADKLKALAAEYPLDLSRAITIGHSAGGQLALWAVSRQNQSPGIDLYRADPLPFRGAVGIAPITDLAAYARQPNCGASVVSLMGGTVQEFSDRYGHVSPAERLPMRVPVRMIAGQKDTIVPLPMLERHLEAAEYVQDDVKLEVVKGAGHFDLITEDGAGWPAVTAAVRELLGPAP